MGVVRRKVDIPRNFYRVSEAITRASLSAGRHPDEVRLLVVTKSQPIDAIHQVIDLGAKYLGENYAEEALPKIQALENFQDIEWHMIGHVQSRKAEQVCEHFSYLHSLDSLKLASRLNRFAGNLGRIIPVLLEFNVSGEDTKFGFQAWQEETWPGLLPEIRSIAQFTNLELRGLMTLPPYSLNPERSRPYFQKIRRLQSFLQREIPQARLDELSMGMSVDFEVAIQEGATWIRIGQAILGPREE
jgi:hypothetical protein